MPPSSSASSAIEDAATPAADAAPARPGGAAPPILVGRAVVDLRGRAVVRTLTNDMVITGTTDGATAYLCSGFWPTPPGPEMAHVLRAYDVAGGALRWSTPVEHCGDLAAGAAGVLAGRYRGGGPGAAWYERAGGVRRDVAPGKAVIAVQAMGDALFAVHEDGVLDVLEGSGTTVRGTAKLPFVPLGFYGGGPPFTDRGTELCGADVDGLRLEVLCVDATPRVRFALREPLGGRGAVLRERGARWVVAATERETRHSLVVDLAGGTVSVRVDAEVAATVRDEAGELDGLLVTQPSTQLLDPQGHVRWTSPEPMARAASALSKDGLVIVASFEPSATGASLVALDAKTGAVRWRGELDLAPIAHSIYRNHVELDFDHGDVVARGHESGQEYLEVFATADGARRFSVLEKR